MSTLAVMIEAQEGVTWQDWFNLIETTETLGFDGLWRSDHFSGTVTAEARESLALWPTLTMVAARSTRIQFGQLVSPISFRNPVKLIRNAQALALLSGNRYILGVGAGWNQREHDQFGFTLPAPKERMDMLEESLELMALLQTGDVVSYDGRHYKLRDAQLRPTATQPGGVPILIGGSGENRTLPLVAKYAQEWNTSILPMDDYRRKTEVLERRCNDINRDPGEICRSIMISHLVGRDDAELLERARRMQQRVPRYQEMPVEQVPATMRERGALVGTADEIVSRIKEWEALGVQRFMLQTLDHADLDALHFFAFEVMPKIS